MLITRILLALVMLIGGGWQLYLEYFRKENSVKHVRRSKILDLIEEVVARLFPLPCLLFVVNPTAIVLAAGSFGNSAFAAATGNVLIASGLFFWLWCQKTLGKHWSSRIMLHDDHQLIRSGPYKWIRHPMYTAFMMLASGITLSTQNWFVCLPVLLHTLLTVSRAKHEEKMLQEVFEDYSTYKLSTGMFFPRRRHDKILSAGNRGGISSPPSTALPGILPGEGLRRP